MIKSLLIKNLATIEDIEIEFDCGFSILTGETGAGKSIIIDGLKLVLGERGSSDLIRTGAKDTSVEAIFSPPPPKIQADELTYSSDTEVFLQRKISAEEQGKGYLDGILVPIRQLKEIGGVLVDIYGQNDHIFLLKTEYQLDYLDHYAAAMSLRHEVAQAAQSLRRLVREKKELEARQRERERRLDFLRFQIKEIEEAQLDRQEDETLRQKREILKNIEKISSSIEEALSVSSEEEHSLTSQLARLQKIAGQLSMFDRVFEEAGEAISQFSITLGEFSDFLFKFKQKYSSSPDDLDLIERRLELIDNLKRKYGGDIPEVLVYLEKARKEFEELSSSEERRADLEKEIRQTFEDYSTRTHELGQLRTRAARELETKVKEEIGLLGMKKAEFIIGVSSTSPDPDNLERVKDAGTEEVEFLVSPNPGEDPKPLRKIASGGELSRIMLALKSIAKEEEREKTLIFDEIDSGIGGKTAEFVAQKLRDLARQNQVICITHLPQIASYATHHYKIEKKIEQDRTYTTVKKLNREERVAEIAQLLSGSLITETSLKNAREMLERNLKREESGQS